MTRDDALHIKQESAWRLLVELFPPGGPGREHHAVKRVTEAVRQLGLQPIQVERIGQAVLEALRKATRCGNQEHHDAPVLIRIWIARAHPEDPSPSSSEAEQGNHRECRGWGFFFIHKQGDNSLASTAKAHHVMDLFLYQEELRTIEIRYRQARAENAQETTRAGGYPRGGRTGGSWNEGTDFC